MESTIKSFGLTGIDPYLVTVESDIARGLPGFDLVGLPDAAVKEARDRIRSACKNCGLTFPNGRVVVNLAPADTKKVGSIYDLPILISILKCEGYFDSSLSDYAFVGEISLNGQLRPVRGVLPMVLEAASLGIEHVIIPLQNAAEGAIVSDCKVYVASDIAEVLDHLKGISTLKRADQIPLEPPLPQLLPDLKDVKGQQEAKRALEIAAAGGHNLLMIGPPGSGKSMLASRLPSILPPMSHQEQVSSTKLYSVSGDLHNGMGLINARPFRAPHHNISQVGLTGGGSPIRPGEISLAHNGVLFLDEMPEFPTKVMESLRQPLENHKVTISRATGRISFPSRFMLVGAMNPCPCGYYGHPTQKCSCSPSAITRYLGKISGPLLDRMDIQVEVGPLDYQSLTDTNPGESSAAVLSRICQARQIQSDRYKGTDITANSGITRSLIESVCKMSTQASSMLKQAFERMGLSARGYDRILKVARTIADLDGSEILEVNHIAEAIQYRSLDRKYWKRD